MLFRNSTLITVIVLILTAGAAQADGLLYRLPEDGAWVRFDLDGTRGPVGVELPVRGSLTMASVGQVREGGEDCRWIELAWAIQQDGNEVNLITKVLIPEKRLKAGEKPLEHMVRGWAKLDEGAPMDVNENPVAAYFLPAALTGPLQEVKPLEPAQIQSKLGPLQCDGLTGFTEYMQDAFEVQATFDIRLNDKAPFGVAASQVRSEFRTGGELALITTDNLKLADFGKDAKSALPRHN